MAALEPPQSPACLASQSIGIPPSPAPTTLSFKEGDDRTHSPSPRDLNRKSTDNIPGDNERISPAAPGLQKKLSKGNMTSKRRLVKGMEYYGEVFAVREQGPPIPKSAGICVELKTNVILENEFEFAKLVSAMIAKRYNRSEEAVCVALDHSACMLMGGTFDGTYILTITSVSMISPTVNKRNAALIADWFNQNLGVPGNRGYIRFVNPDFADYAIGGFTTLDMMEREELIRTGSTERTGVVRERSVKRSISRHLSKRDRKSEMTTEEPKQNESPIHNSPRQADASPRKVRTKRSMFNIFAKSQRSS